MPTGPFQHQKNPTYTKSGENDIFPLNDPKNPPLKSFAVVGRVKGAHVSE